MKGRGFSPAIAGACEFGVGFVTLDSSANIWTATSVNSTDLAQYVCRFSNTGALQFSLLVPSGVAGQAGGASGFSSPRGLATDKGDNVFFTDKDLDTLYSVAKGTTTNGTISTTTTVPGQLSAPSWVAVDGANTIWVSNTGDAGATTGAKYGTGLVQFNDSGSVATAKYITGATYRPLPVPA